MVQHKHFGTDQPIADFVRDTYPVPCLVIKNWRIDYDRIKVCERCGQTVDVVKTSRSCPQGLWQLVTATRKMPDRKELEQPTADGRVNPEAFTIRSEEAWRLREAVQKLPAQYRIVLVLRDMEGPTDDEVAEITGLRSGTVRVRLHGARLFVRKELMRTWMAGRGKGLRGQRHTVEEIRPERCKAIFAELSEYLDEQLDDSLCEKMERHISGCAPCQVFVATLQATIEQCRNSAGDCPPRRLRNCEKK